LPTRPANVLDLDVMIKIRDDIVPILVRALPTITRKDVIALIKDAWPTVTSKGQEMFDASLILSAHTALLRENPTWKAQAATRTVADRLNVSMRTIETLLSRARAPRKD
jgi:hypothetical protein